MKYSIEISKIIEGALKYDQVKVKNYTKQLIKKLIEDGEIRTADKFEKIIEIQGNNVLTSMSNTQTSNVPVDIESRTSMADIVYPSEINAKVVLSDNNYQKLRTFVLSYKNADKLNSAGVGVTNTLLLYGPPGCGKTQSAYLIAKELELPLVIARLDSIISSYLGTTAKNIRTLFEYTQKIPCVLFLDEFDAIAKARDDSNELGELKRVVNSLLQNIDSMSKDSLLLAATNHEDLLDTAVWRRFDYKLEIELPDVDSIRKIIDIFIGNNTDFNDKDKNELAHIFIGLSGANIEDIIKKAIRNSIIYNQEFSKYKIYEEFFIYKQLYVSDKYNAKDITIKKAKYLRECNSKIFSYAVIADILQISKTQVSTILTEEVK